MEEKKGRGRGGKEGGKWGKAEEGRGRSDTWEKKERRKWEEREEKEERE